MQQIFNNPKLKDRRKQLRKNQTEAEGLLWRQLRNKQINDLKFYRQYSVGGYILDFYCPSKRLAVEVDGGQHNAPEYQAYDKERSLYLKQHGITVVRFWNNEVKDNLPGVVDQIKKFL